MSADCGSATSLDPAAECVRVEWFEISESGHRLRAQWLHPMQPRPGRPTVVFLHEGLGSIPQWRDFPARLCAALGTRGLVFERWGFGGSDPLQRPREADYLMREAHQALPQVLTVGGIRRPLLVGHSDGASIALIHAAHAPDQVAGVVSMAAHVFIEDITLAGIRVARQAYLEGGLRARLERFHGDNTDAMFSGWADAWLAPAFRDLNLLPLLPEVRCPVLAIQGQDDEYGTEAQLLAIAEGVEGPVESALIPGCRHIPHLQSAERTLDLIVRFVDAHVATG